MMNRLLWEKYKDGTMYIDRHFENAINIGWLRSLPSSFSSKKLPEEARKKLFEYTKIAYFNTIRSISPCPICNKKVEFNGRPIGFGEIRVISFDGKVFAARDLLLHFIEEHGYYPPEEFVDALCFSPPVESKTFIDYESRYEEDELYFWGASDSYISKAENLISALKKEEYNKLSHWFLESPKDVDIVYHEGSLISYAILNRSPKQVKFLLSAGIDIGKLSGIELVQAIQQGQNEIAIELIKAQIPICHFSGGANPLYCAITANQPEIVKRLQERE